MNHIAGVQIFLVKRPLSPCAQQAIFIHLVFLVILEMKGTLVKLKYEPSAATTFILGSRSAAHSAGQIYNHRRVSC